MLSYRHAFHAGSFADVLKHAVLVHVLRHAVRKPKPVYVLDTHAGAGSYDLDTPMALKTGEFRAGIGRLLAAPAPWPELVRTLSRARPRRQPAGELRCYPGSPALARALLRPQDRLELVELHGTDHAAAGRQRRPGAAGRGAPEDGLAALVARMPPPERRGVVLIDPSYEIKTDYQDVVRGRLARGASPLRDRHLPALVSGDRTRAGRGDAGRAGATGIPRQFRLELGLAARRAGPRHDRVRHGRDQPALDPAGRRRDGTALAGSRNRCDGRVVADWLTPPADSTGTR